MKYKHSVICTPVVQTNFVVVMVDVFSNHGFVIIQLIVQMVPTKRTANIRLVRKVSSPVRTTSV